MFMAPPTLVMEPVSSPKTPLLSHTLVIDVKSIAEFTGLASHAQISYPPPFSSFTEQPIFGNTHPHGYPATQDLALFHEQDITNSIDFNPSPLSHSNIHALTAAHPIPSLRHASYDNTPSSTPSLAADSENISEHICMSTPTHSPTEHFDHVNVTSSYDLPCLYCSLRFCRLHPPEFSYRRDYFTDGKLN